MSRRSNVIRLAAKGGKIATSRPAHGILHTLAGDVETVWQVPEEVPVALQFNSENYTVMMATPADFEDFGIGFAIAEGLIARAAHATRVLVLPSEQGYAIDLSVLSLSEGTERSIA